MRMNSLPSSLRIGVLRGGPSSEYDVSLETGANILKQLSLTHKPLDIFISKDGVWHMHGVPRTPEKILQHTDVIFNALHGEFGEDGRVQHILNSIGVPYTGSETLPSSMSMNKLFSKELFLKHNIKTPQHTSFRVDEDIMKKSAEIFRTFIMPVIIKPASGGSSIGISIAKNIPEIAESIKKSLEFGSSVIIEEYIKGKEATCAVVQDFRGQELYVLLPIEVRHNTNSFFDYNSKYMDDRTEQICPGRFSKEEKETIERYAKEAHKALGLRHYSRSDFIVSPRRGVYILETNSLPGMTSHSFVPKSLEAVGVSMKDFIHHVLHLALNKK